MHNIKFTILYVLRCTIQWHGQEERTGGPKPRVEGKSTGRGSG